MSDKKVKEPKEPKEKKVKQPKEKKVKEPKVKPFKAPKMKKQKMINDREKWTKKYFKKFSGKQDNSYELMLNEDYENAIVRAHKLLAITESDYDKPIIITVPDAFGTKDRVNYRLDKKPDGTYSLLYDQALVTALFYGADSLYYYHANVNHRNGHIAYDFAGEFNYFDVVHIGTSIQYDNPDSPKFVTLDLEIGLADGQKISIHLRNHRIHENYELPEILMESESKIIATLRDKVRVSRTI